MEIEDQIETQRQRAKTKGKINKGGSNRSANKA